jgi:hypothetical protein
MLLRCSGISGQTGLVFWEIEVAFTPFSPTGTKQ